VALVINTNIASIDTQRYLTTTQNSLNTSLQRLSSGLRINSAADDAAGFAIAQSLTSQVNGDTVASQNANNAVSLAQTAEGSLNAITDNLQRIRELAVESANATNSTANRASLNTEAQQLLQEIDRTASTASFNGVNLLDGSFQAQQFQIGANAGDTISINSIASSRTSALGSSAAAAVTSQQVSALNTGTHTGPAAMADGDLLINSIDIGPSLASADTASTASAAASAISKAAAVNAKSGLTGVTATVNATNVAGSSMTAAAHSGSVVINGITVNIVTTASADSTRAAVVTAINAVEGETGVQAVDTGTATGGVQLVAADGRNIDLGAFTTVTSAETGLGTKNTTYAGSYTLNSSNPITLSSGTSGTLGNAGFDAGTYQSQTAYAGTTANAVGTGTAIAAGDFSINGVLVGASVSTSDNLSYQGANSNVAASAIAKAAAINAISQSTGVTAKANANTVTGSAMTVGAGTGDSGSLVINGVATAVITATADASTNRTSVVNAINAISGQTGVVAVNTESSTAGVQLVAADGRNVTVEQGTTNGGTLTSKDTGLNAAFGVADTTTKLGTFVGTMTLSSTTAFTVGAGTTGTSLSTSLGLNIGTYGAGKNGEALSSVDLSTADGATAALTAIDNALSTISSTQATLGAIQNRFTSVIGNLATTGENLSAAQSSIQDADFAAETANYSKEDVLLQAGTSMLAQANSNPQQVLSLLQHL
jgi:flagellin